MIIISHIQTGGVGKNCFTRCDQLTLWRFHEKVQGEFPRHSWGNNSGAPIHEGFVGAIFSQIYPATYGQNNTGLILLLGILPAALSLAVMLIVTVRTAKVVVDKELKRFYSFLYIALALAGFLMIVIVVENMAKNFPQSGYQIVVASAILSLTITFVVVVNAEMDNMVNMKLQIFSSQSTNESQNPVHIDVREDEVKIKNDEKPKTEINLAKFISDPVASQEGKSSEQPKSLTSRLIKMFKSPTRGEDYTIPQALLSADMKILFVATTCGVGTTLTAIDSMDQIGKALGYPPVNISTSVSLISIWNFLGHVMAGFRSEFLMQNKVLNHLPCCGYMDLKKASLLVRNLAKKRLFVVFICFLIMSPAEGTFMRGIYPKPQSTQTISDSDINQYVPAVHSGRGASEIVAHSGHTAVDVSNVEKNGKHDSTQRTAATMEDMVPKPRKLSEPNKPQLNRGRGAQHN